MIEKIKETDKFMIERQAKKKCLDFETKQLEKKSKKIEKKNKKDFLIIYIKKKWRKKEILIKQVE